MCDLDRRLLTELKSRAELLIGRLEYRLEEIEQIEDVLASGQGAPAAASQTRCSESGGACSAIEKFDELIAGAETMLRRLYETEVAAPAKLSQST